MPQGGDKGCLSLSPAPGGLSQGGMQQAWVGGFKYQIEHLKGNKKIVSMGAEVAAVTLLLEQ